MRARLGRRSVGSQRTAHQVATLGIIPARELVLALKRRKHRDLAKVYGTSPLRVRHTPMDTDKTNGMPRSTPENPASADFQAARSCVTINMPFAR